MIDGIRQIAFAPAFRLRNAAASALESAVSQSSTPRITSALRTRAQQEALYARYLDGTGNLAAKPGTSLHETGLALDARGTADWENAMRANGWVRPLMTGKNAEPWHWEYRP